MTSFLSGINESFLVKSKEGQELSYLYLCIIISPYGISIYQLSHIKYTILSQWFPGTSERVNSDTIPFKEDITFDIELSDTLTATPDKIHYL